MSVTGTQEFSRSIAAFIAPISGFQEFAREIGTTDETITLILGDDQPAPTGLVGTLTVAIYTLTNNVVYPASTANIVESPPGTGRYVAVIPRPDVGRYLVVWSDGITTTDPVDLIIFSDAFAVAPLTAVTEAPYAIKTGDLQPALIVTLTNADGTPINLTFADSITVRVRYHTGIILLERTALVLDAEGGEVMLDWADGEQDTPGIFDVEWLIHYPDDLIATVPSRGFYRFTRYDTLIVQPSNRWTLN